MIPNHRMEIGVLASQVLACLDEYESGMQRLEGTRWDPELHAGTTACFDQMKNYASSLPALSRPWVEVLISRFELAAHQWTLHQARGDATARALHAKHMAALRALRSKTLEIAPVRL
jgi:hypothetical protein